MIRMVTALVNDGHDPIVDIFDTRVAYLQT